MQFRVLLLSDIHSNAAALTAVLEDAQFHGPYDARYCAGDIVGYGPNPNECVSKIREAGFVSVDGNHDRAVLEQTQWYVMRFSLDAMQAVKLNSAELTPASREYLASLSSAPHIDAAHGIAVVHGSFDGSNDNCPQLDEHADRYIKDSRGMKKLPRDDNGRIFIGAYGHTHKPVAACISLLGGGGEVLYKGITQPDYTLFNIRNYTEYFINPGSVGQPRNKSPLAWYGIVSVDGDKLVFEHRAVEYSIRETQYQMSRKRFPQGLIDRLAAGE